MLERFRGVQAIVMRPLARALVRLGVSPDAVTWFGTLSVVVAALICFPRGWLWPGALLVAVLSCSDMIDGHMAREQGSTGAWGSFLDAALDRVADAAILGGLAWWLGLTAGPWWAAVAVTALAGGQVTAYAKARAEAIGCRADIGVVTRADRVAIALLGALLTGLGVAYALEVAMVLLAIGGWITVAQRFGTVRRQLRARASDTTGELAGAPGEPAARQVRV